MERDRDYCIKRERNVCAVKNEVEGAENTVQGGRETPISAVRNEINGKDE